jgi:hypothetical protein
MTVDKCQMILRQVPAQERVDGFGYSNVPNLKKKLKRLAQLRKKDMSNIMLH